MSQVDSPRRAIRVALIQQPDSPRDLDYVLIENGIDTSAELSKADIVLVDLSNRPDDELGCITTKYQEHSLGKPLIFLVTPTQLDLPYILELAQSETIVIRATGERSLLSELSKRTFDMDRAREAAIRLRAMSASGLGALPAHQTAIEASALLVAPPGPRALDLSSELSLLTSLNTVMSRQQALTALELGVADRVFILPERNRRPMAAMIKLIRRHSELCGVPIIALEEKLTDRHRDYWTRLGADAVISATQPALAAALSHQRQRTHDARRSTMGLLRHLSFTDLGEQSRLCAPRFFDTCLALRCASDASFSLAALRLNPHAGDVGRQAFTEPAIYVALGCQPTDLVTRVAPDLLLISMASADLLHAKRNMRMVSAMVQDLKFGTQNSPVTFRTTSSIVAAKPGVSPRTLIRDVLDGLQSSKTSADFLHA